MTFSSHNLTPDQVKAISITGKPVTVRIDGETYTGVAVTVEGDTWGTAIMDDGRVAIDLDCTLLKSRPEPKVGYKWETPWGQSTTQWATLGQVTPLVSLPLELDRRSV